MSDAQHLDPARARTDFERCVIELRNQQRSWSSIAERMCCSIRIARDAWARANAHQRGQQPRSGPAREDPTIGNEELLRGLPMFPPGGGIRGAIAGTRPGDSAWLADRDARLCNRRKARYDARDPRPQDGRGVCP